MVMMKPSVIGDLNGRWSRGRDWIRDGDMEEMKAKNECKSGNDGRGTRV